MTATQAGQGIVALACGHSRTLPVPDAMAAAMIGGQMYCPQCSLDGDGPNMLSSIVTGQFLLLRTPAQAMRDRAAAALAEYEARKAAAPARKRGALFYPEMAGLLSQALRGWLEATDE